MNTTNADDTLLEKRFDLGAGLVLAVALGFAALVVAVTVAILARPGDGWQIPGSSQTSTLAYLYGDWPTPLRAGDEVLAVDGLDVSAADNTWLTWHNLPAWQAGATVQYTVRRAGQLRTVPVTLHTPDAAGLLRALAATAGDTPTEWSWPILALVIFALRPGSQAARLLLVAMVSHAAVVKLGWAAFTIGSFFAPPGLMYLNQLGDNFWTWLFWPTVIWLVLSFPLPVWPLARWPRATPVLLYAVPGALVLSAFITGNIAPFAVGLFGELALLALALVLAGRNAYRHSNQAVPRAQVAWVVLGFALSQGLVLLAYLLVYLYPPLAALPGLAYVPFPLALPVCLGIAITRYRLWDIDVILRRTLAYSLLTGLLAAVYLGCVVLLQGAFAALSPRAAAPSELVTVLSTLAIAALFVPLRRRVQAFIDRRFYRRRYDAARILARFSATLRDDVNLDDLSARLLATVEETLQPESVGLWLVTRRP